MSEQADLIEASKLFKDMAVRSFGDNLSFGYGYLMAIATEYAGLQTEDDLNKKTYSRVFSEFIDGVSTGKIAIVGDRGIMQRIDGGKHATFGIAIDYRETKDISQKNLPVVIINRHIKSLVESPHGLVNTSSGIEAISQAVYTMNVVPENMRVNASEIADDHFEQYGITPPLVPSD